MVAIGSLVFIAGTMGFALNPVLEYFSADAIARRALEAKKTEEAAEHTKRGKALAKSGNTKAAAYEFSRALELEPESAATYLNLGRLYSSALQDDEALVVLEKAVDLDSGNEEAQFLLANVHFRRNECDEAVRGYEKVLALNAKNKDAKKNLQTCNDYLRPKGTKGG